MGISQGTGDLRLAPLAGPPVAGVCSGPAVAGICSSGAVKLAAGRDVASANVASVKTLVSIIYLSIYLSIQLFYLSSFSGSGRFNLMLGDVAFVNYDTDWRAGGWREEGEITFLLSFLLFVLVGENHGRHQAATLLVANNLKAFLKHEDKDIKWQIL